MQTAIIFNEFREGLKYICLQGDYTHFHGIYINLSGAPDGVDLTDDEYQEVCNNLSEVLYDKAGNFVNEQLTLQEFVEKIREGAELIECGFIP